MAGSEKPDSGDDYEYDDDGAASQKAPAAKAERSAASMSYRDDDNASVAFSDAPSARGGAASKTAASSRAPSMSARSNPPMPAASQPSMSGMSGEITYEASEAAGSVARSQRSAAPSARPSALGRNPSESGRSARPAPSAPSASGMSGEIDYQASEASLAASQRSARPPPSQRASGGGAAPSESGRSARPAARSASGLTGELGDEASEASIAPSHRSAKPTGSARASGGGMAPSESGRSARGELGGEGSEASMAPSLRSPKPADAPSENGRSARRAPSASGMSGLSGDIDFERSEVSIAPSQAQSAKPTRSTRPSGGGTAPSESGRSARPAASAPSASAMSGEIDYQASEASLAASQRSARPASAAQRASGGSAAASESGRSARPAPSAPSASGMSGLSGEIDHEGSEAGSAAPSRRSSAQKPPAAVRKPSASQASLSMSAMGNEEDEYDMDEDHEAEDAGPQRSPVSVTSARSAARSAGRAAGSATSSKPPAAAAAGSSYSYSIAEGDEAEFGGEPAVKAQRQSSNLSRSSSTQSHQPAVAASPSFASQASRAQEGGEAEGERGSPSKQPSFNVARSSTGGVTPSSRDRPRSATGSSPPVFQKVQKGGEDDQEGDAVSERPGSARSGRSRSAARDGGGEAPEPSEWSGQVRVPPRPHSRGSAGLPPGDEDGAMRHSGGSIQGTGSGYNSDVSSPIRTSLGSKMRPVSAAPRDRQAAQLQALTRRPPSSWDPRDVALWVEYIGLGQYRKKFLHHCIDGRMLLALTDEQLKSEVGIGPMGHRRALLDAVVALQEGYEEQRAEGGGDEEDEEGGGGAGGGRPRSAAPGRTRPMSANMQGALTQNPSNYPRRPASASKSVIPPDPYLGPALGKVTVYEQRAKLLFELDRAEARAAQQRALVDQLKHTANLTTDEVAHLRGLLQDLEHKNKMALVGADRNGNVRRTLDSKARIPWVHVGNGTKLQNWNPERFAAPGEAPTMDLTFQPKISAGSKRLMREGRSEGSASNDFLARLDNDLRKRQGAIKELERKYYSNETLQGPGSQQKRFDQDFDFVSSELARRLQMGLERNPEEYEQQIDSAVASLSSGRTWADAGLSEGAITGARGPAKVTAMATAIRTMMFIERYRSELRNKDDKAKKLERKWQEQTLGAQYLPGAKDGEDLSQALQFFGLLGWRDGEGEEPVTEERLDALLRRAMEVRARYDSWWEKVRDKPEDRAAGFRCDLDFNREHPFASDGLAHLMAVEAARRGEGADLDGPTGAGSSGGATDYVDFAVKLLGRCRPDDLKRLVAMSGRPKRLAVYRALRTQKFIEFTQKDLAERDRKLRQAYDSMRPQKKVIPPNQMDGFFERLMEDGAKRRAKAEKLFSDKVAKEQELLASSVMYARNARPKSARR